MQARPFKYFLTHLASLTRRQREQLLALLLPAAKLDKVADLIEQAGAADLACPACRSRKLYRHGRANGLQRYRCRACGRTCNALSGTSLARLRHKERWLDYLQGMLDFRGVASRYLENYLGWRWALDGNRIASPEALLRAALGVRR